MLKQSRPLDALERIFNLCKIYVHSGVEFEKPGFTENAVKEVLRTNSAFHTKLSECSISKTKCEPRVVKIPHGIKSLDDVSKWLYKENTPNANESLGSIAYDDTRIVIGTSHICGDGTHHARMIEHLCNPEEKWPNAVLPESPTHYFYDQIFNKKDGKNNAFVCENDPDVTRVISKRKPASKKDAEFVAEAIKIPFEEMACYDRFTKKCHGISEAQMIANGLSAAAYQDKIDPFGISTVYNLRKILTPQQRKNPEIQNFIASVLVDAKPTPDMTLGELSLSLRSCLKRREANQAYFGHLYNMWEVVFHPSNVSSQEGIGMEVSSVGKINVKSPVKDAWLVLRSPNENEMASTSFLSFSLIGEEKRNFMATFQFCSNELNKLDGLKIAHSVDFCLRNLKNKMTVKEAINYIKEFQKTQP